MISTVARVSVFLYIYMYACMYFCSPVVRASSAFCYVPFELLYSSAGILLMSAASHMSQRNIALPLLVELCSMMLILRFESFFGTPATCFVHRCWCICVQWSMWYVDSKIRVIRELYPTALFVFFCLCRSYSGITCRVVDSNIVVCCVFRRVRCYAHVLQLRSLVVLIRLFVLVSRYSSR